MRVALTSLILAAGLAGAAQAQDQTPAAPAQPAPAQPAPPAPGAVATPAPTTEAPATPAAPAAPATTTPSAAAPTSPATTAPTPAAPSAAAPAPAEPPPTLPTTGDGAAIIRALDKVCVPAVRGQGLEAAAKAAGLKRNRRDDTWSMPLGGDKAYAIIFQPQYSQKDVCRAEVHYAVGQEKPIVTAINVWSFLQKPMLILGANYVATDADGVKRVRMSWESQDLSRAVNFSTWHKPDGTPLDPHYDKAMLFYQERAPQ